jgi:predicted TIM-barrel fold metal-dependent hydrolase
MPVVSSVHIEAECDRSQALQESSWLMGIAQKTNLPTALIGYVDLLSSNCGEQLDRQMGHQLFRGVRYKPLTSRTPNQSVHELPGSLQDPRWFEGLQQLSSRGLIWDLRVPFWHLAEAAELLKQCPTTRVVIEHAGLPWDRSPEGLAKWRQGMRLLADLPNGICVKLSELGLADEPWKIEDNTLIVHELVAMFGWDRCMFGSNFPVASLRISYCDLVRAISHMLSHLGGEARQAIWHDNAKRVYSISEQRICDCD